MSDSDAMQKFKEKYGTMGASLIIRELASRLSRGEDPTPLTELADEVASDLEAALDS